MVNKEDLLRIIDSIVEREQQLEEAQANLIFLEENLSESDLSESDLFEEFGQDVRDSRARLADNYIAFYSALGKEIPITNDIRDIPFDANVRYERLFNLALLKSTIETPNKQINLAEIEKPLNFLSASLMASSPEEIPTIATAMFTSIEETNEPSVESEISENSFLSENSEISQNSTNTRLASSLYSNLDDTNPFKEDIRRENINNYRADENDINNPFSKAFFNKR